jgi:hypothetical protein
VAGRYDKGAERALMADEIRDVSGSRFEQVNLSGTRIHGAFLIDTQVTDAWVHSLGMSGNIQSAVLERHFGHAAGDRRRRVMGRAI